MPAPILTYQDYFRQHQGVDEGGSPTNTAVDEATWSAMSPQEQWANVGGALRIANDDPRYAQLAGTKPEDGRPITIVGGSFDANSNSYQGVQVVKDPSRVVQGDGWFAYSDDNLTAEIQDHNDVGFGGSGDDKWDWVKGAVFMATAGAAGGAFAGAGAAGGGAGFTAGGSAGIGAGASGAITADVATGAITAGGAAAAAPTVATTTPPPVEAPPPTTPAPATTTQPGIIDSVRNGANQVGTWYNNLGPAGRAIVNQGVSAGASALLGANAQRDASEAADEREEQNRQDFVRRTTVKPYGPSAFTPKPAGIIGSAFTPKPGGG